MPRPHPPEFRAEAIRLARDLCAEISRTTFSSNPRRVRKTEVTWSWKPYLYSPTSVAASSCSVNCVGVIGRRSRLHACQPPWFETTWRSSVEGQRATWERPSRCAAMRRAYPEPTS